MAVLPKPAPHFADMEGRTWRLILNVGLAEEVQQALGVDFLNAHNGQALAAIGASDKLLVQTLWMLVEAQAKEQSIAPEAFVRAIAGAQLEDAAAALEEAILVFTRPALRPVMEGMLAKAKGAQQAAINLANAKLQGPKVDSLIGRKLEQMGHQLDRELDAAFADTSSPTSGPGSPASTPDPTP